MEINNDEAFVETRKRRFNLYTRGMKKNIAGHMEADQSIAASMLPPVAAKAWRACASDHPMNVSDASALMFLFGKCDVMKDSK